MIPLVIFCALSLLAAILLHFFVFNRKRVAVVDALFVYPVKSCRWIQVQEWPLTHKGLELDRQFMVVNAETKRFVTQRQSPKMVLIQPALDLERRLMSLSYPGVKDLVVPLDEPRAGELHTVHVWGDACEAVDVGEEAASWLSRVLDMNVRLVRFADDARRPTAKGNAEVHFPDQYPLLLCSTEAINQINRQLGGAVDVTPQRFRPNILLGGCEPHAEDAWTGRDIEISGIPISMVQHCSRCRIPNIDPTTGGLGDVSSDKVTQAMNKYRKGSDIGLTADGKAVRQVYFGEHGIPRRKGVIAVGDVVYLRGAELIATDDLRNSNGRKRI